MAGTALSVTYERSLAVDFTYPFSNDPDVLLMPYPQLASNLFGLIRPFDYWVRYCFTVQAVEPNCYFIFESKHIQVWIGIIVSLFITAAAIWQTSHVESLLVTKFVRSTKISEHVWLLFRVIANGK